MAKKCHAADCVVIISDEITYCWPCYNKVYSSKIGDKYCPTCNHFKADGTHHTACPSKDSPVKKKPTYAHGFEIGDRVQHRNVTGCRGVIVEKCRENTFGNKCIPVQPDGGTGFGIGLTWDYPDKWKLIEKGAPVKKQKNPDIDECKTCGREKLKLQTSEADGECWNCYSKHDQKHDYAVFCYACGNYPEAQLPHSKGCPAELPPTKPGTAGMQYEPVPLLKKTVQPRQWCMRQFPDTCDVFLEPQEQNKTLPVETYSVARRQDETPSAFNARVAVLVEALNQGQLCREFELKLEESIKIQEMFAGRQEKLIDQYEQKYRDRLMELGKKNKTLSDDVKTYREQLDAATERIKTLEDTMFVTPHKRNMVPITDPDEQEQEEEKTPPPRKSLGNIGAYTTYSVKYKSKPGAPGIPF